MARPINLIYPADNTTLVASLQNVAANGYLQLNGDYVGINKNPGTTGYPYAPATIPNMARPISLTSANNLSAVNFTFRGLDIFGVFQTETRAGPNNNTVQTMALFQVLYSIQANGISNAVSAGTGIGANFGWRSMNVHNVGSEFTLTSQVTGTIDYEVQWTGQQIEYPNLHAPVNVLGFPLPTPLTATTSDIKSVSVPATGFNLLVSPPADTATGASMTLTIVQQGLK